MKLLPAKYSHPGTHEEGSETTEHDKAGGERGSKLAAEVTLDLPILNVSSAASGWGRLMSWLSLHSGGRQSSGESRQCPGNSTTSKTPEYNQILYFRYKVTSK